MTAHASFQTTITADNIDDILQSTLASLNSSLPTAIDLYYSSLIVQNSAGLQHLTAQVRTLWRSLKCSVTRILWWFQKYWTDVWKQATKNSSWAILKGERQRKGLWFCLNSCWQCFLFGYFTVDNGNENNARKQLREKLLALSIPINYLVANFEQFLLWQELFCLYLLPYQPGAFIRIL